jgi:hypothetical protein
VVAAESVFDHAEAHGIDGRYAVFGINEKALPT